MPKVTSMEELTVSETEALNIINTGELPEGFVQQLIQVLTPQQENLASDPDAVAAVTISIVPDDEYGEL